MDTENRDWGHRRIQGALANLGYEVSRGAIANILKAHGLELAPERSRNDVERASPPIAAGRDAELLLSSSSLSTWAARRWMRSIDQRL